MRAQAGCKSIYHWVPLGNASAVQITFLEEINLIVGADAHIGPQKILRIRQNQMETIKLYRRADVGIGPYG